MGFLDSLRVNAGRRQLTINLAHALRIEAVEDGVKLHMPDRTFSYGSSLAVLLGRLDPAKFMQISPSTVVNLDRVDEFTVLPTGEFTVTLRDGSTFEASADLSDEITLAQEGDVTNRRGRRPTPRDLHPV